MAFSPTAVLEREAGTGSGWISRWDARRALIEFLDAAVIVDPAQ
jgi:hypothetical protein